MIKTITYKNLTWHDIEKPTESDLEFLKKNFNFHHILLKELTMPTRRMKMEKYDDYLYFVFQIPIFDKRTRLTVSRELDVLVTHQVIITAHSQLLLPLKPFWDHINLYEENKNHFMGQGIGKFMYYLIDSLIASYFPKLDHIIENVDGVERKIFEGKERFLINEISYIKRDILSFRRIIKSQHNIIESFAKFSRKFFLQEDIGLYFDDLIGDYSRAIDIIENQKEVIEALEKTNESIFYFKLNDSLKLLTIFSTILLPINLLISFFSIKISSWPLVVFFGLLISGIMLYYFHHKKWI